MRWDEMGWDEMRWNEMKWDKKWDDMRFHFTLHTLQTITAMLGLLGGYSKIVHDKIICDEIRKDY